MRRTLTVLACLLLINLRGFEIPQETGIPEGAAGVWQVPDLGTRSPIYTSTGVGQDVVDREDAALLRNYGRGRLICDHLGSEVGGGIWDVSEIRVGSAGFLILQDRTLCYRCTAVWIVKDGTYCYTYNGAAIWPAHSTDILCASCAITEGEDYLACFEFTGELPP